MTRLFGFIIGGTFMVVAGFYAVYEIIIYQGNNGSKS